LGVGHDPREKEKPKLKTTKKAAAKKTTKGNFPLGVSKTPKATTSVKTAKLVEMKKDSLGEVIPEATKSAAKKTIPGNTNVVALVEAVSKEIAQAKPVPEPVKAAIQEAGKAKTPKAMVAKIEKALTDAVKPAKAAKKTITHTTKEQAPDVLKVRLYAKGEFYFGAAASARIGDMPKIHVDIKGKTITLTPTQQEAPNTLPVMKCHAASVLRVKKLLKDFAWSGETQNLIAKPVGILGFQVEVR
jgi:hypothetical protein